MNKSVVDVKDKVVVPPSFLDRMIEHALSENPNECCGILGGTGNVITSVHPIKNDNASPTRYFGNPQDLFKASKKIRNHGEEMAGIYHSHPTSEAVPSDTDRAENGYPGLFYFIISLKNEEPDVRCYILPEEDEPYEVEIV